MSRTEQPVWVLIPKTTTMVNVAPLLWISFAMGFDGAFDVIDEAIKRIIIYSDSDSMLEGDGYLFSNLYEIRDAFKDLNNGQTILPETKNKKTI